MLKKPHAQAAIATVLKETSSAGLLYTSAAPEF